ncbi:peptide chain release factor 2 [Candidatus Falkowbacteria bacterium]|nr:peptide chain release factor 2 [Candidatus Falkowbacteria bacterium]
MTVMENLLKQLEELRERLLDIWGLLDIDQKKSKIKNQKLKMSEPNFWDNREKAVEISREVEWEEEEVAKWERLKKEITELEELVAVAQKEGDTSIDEEARKQYKELKDKLDKLEFFVLFSGKYDRNNAVLSIHAGTGGTEAQDWAQMLERMYLRFAEKRGWRAEILDRNTGTEAGIKNVSIKIDGLWAYGYLRSESGVHRLVRISPFDAEQMRHTSFALVEVIPELPEAETIEIKAEELDISTYGSSGPGGQHMQKTESAVRVKHKPSGITVAVQSERSQHQNKEKAMKILKSKLFKLREEEQEKETKKLRGETQKAEWGKQIRSYVMQPYQMVKDHRTEHETSNIKAVLDGELEEFMESYLRSRR